MIKIKFNVHLLFSIFLLVLGAFINIFIIYVNQMIIDDYFTTKSLFYSLLYLVIFCNIAYTSIMIMAYYMLEKYFLNEYMFINKNITQSLFNLSLKNKNKYDISSLEVDSIEPIMEFYYKKVILFISELAISIFAYIYAFYISWIIGFISIIFMIINFIFNNDYGKRIDYIFSKNRNISNLFFTFIKSACANITNFFSTGTYKKFYAITRKESRKYFDIKLKLNDLFSNIQFRNSLVYVIQKLILLSASTILFISKELTGGQLIATLFLSTLISSPLINLSNIYKDIISTKKIRKDLFDLINYENKYENKIRYDNDNFIYIGDEIIFEDKLIIKKHMLSLQKNKKYLVLGKNGSGKTTLMRNLYLKISEVNSSIYIPQRFETKNDMINNKILEVIESSDSIRTYNGVFKLDINFKELINYNISQGENQKLIILYVLADKKDFIFLDETLSSVDMDSKEKILNILLEIEDQTLFYIGHKIDRNCLKKFDAIIYIEDNEVRVMNNFEEENVSEIFKF